MSVLLAGGANVRDLSLLVHCRTFDGGMPILLGSRQR